MTSLPVPSLPVTWLPFMSHPLAMLLPVMRNCTLDRKWMIPFGVCSDLFEVLCSTPRVFFYHVCVLTVVFLLNNVRVKWMKWYPVAILLPVMRNDTFYTNTIVRKKRGENDVTSCAVTSGHVTSVHVTSISHATSGHAQLYISYYCYGKKKSAGMPFRACAEHTSGYDVTSCDVIRPKVDDSPWGVFWFVRGVV
jgi:hypothetical protein